MSRGRSGRKCTARRRPWHWPVEGEVLGLEGIASRIGGLHLRVSQVWNTAMTKQKLETVEVQQLGRWSTMQYEINCAGHEGFRDRYHVVNSRPEECLDRCSEIKCHHLHRHRPDTSSTCTGLGSILIAVCSSILLIYRRDSVFIMGIVMMGRRLHHDLDPATRSSSAEISPSCFGSRD